MGSEQYNGRFHKEVLHMEQGKLILERSYKKVYQLDKSIVKVFHHDHPKSHVFNEALNMARVEEAGLDIPKLQKVEHVDGEWAIFIEYKNGKTLEEMMQTDPANVDRYMEDFVDLQLKIHEKEVSLLENSKDKLAREIQNIKELDATTRYDLLTRLESMPRHRKLCHGDFNPSNVIVGENGKLTAIDWAHATSGNGGADAAMTYLLFALKDRELATLYMKCYCQKSDTPMQYVQQWLPLVAAAQLGKRGALQKEFLMNWIDIMDYH